MTTSTHPRAHSAVTGGVRALLYHANQVGELARLLGDGAGELRDEHAAEGVGSTIGQLVQQARRRPVTSRIGVDALPVGTANGPLGELHRFLLENPGPTRLLVSRSSWDEQTGGPRPPAPDATTAVVRVAGPRLPEVTVIDGTVAILGGSSGRPAVLRDRRTVRALEALFDTTWDGAVDYGDFAGADSGLLRAVEQDSALAQVLPLLGAGWTDEAAARELGWSVRTYRRRVADLMERLRARSRFEAGMRAAQFRLHRGSD